MNMDYVYVPVAEQEGRNIKKSLIKSNTNSALNGKQTKNSKKECLQIKKIIN